MAGTPAFTRLLRRHPAIVVPAIYAAVAGVYIVVSDLAVHDPVADASDLNVSIAMGLAFVLDTGLLLHLLLRYAFVPAAEHRAALSSHGQALDALPNVFFEIDDAGRLIGWNDPALRLTGAEPAALDGAPLATLFDAGTSEAAAAALDRLRATGGTRTFDAALRGADGAAVPYAWHAVARRDEGGVPAGAYLIGVDVSTTASIGSALRDAVGGEQAVLRQSIEAIMHTVELRDPYTAGHQARVADLAVAIGTRLGLSDARIEGLHYGALLHDLGKIAVPGELLSRPDRLDALEMAIMRHHTLRGDEVLRHLDVPWPLADIARHHHERIDGSGYPDGLTGEAISLEARIVGVADVVEAMTSHRPYRAALGVDRALDEVRSGAGQRYDSAVVDACLAVFTAGFAFTPSKR